MRRILAAAVCVLLASMFASSAEAELRFSACATGAQEVPPPGVDTDAGASAHVRFDAGLTQARVAVRVKNLPALSAAHFHCGEAGANGPVAFGLVSPGPCEVVDDRITCLLTNEHANPAADCLTAIGHDVKNIAALRAAMEQGKIYLNLHSQSFPLGEIRGQVTRVNREGCFIGGELLAGASEDEEGIGIADDEFGEVPQRRSPLKR
jgi:hypothetical protein